MKKMLSLILALCLVLACASTAFAAVPKFMSVGTGSTGGAYYPIGVAIAEVLTSKLGTQATAEVTGGSLDNLMLINQGDCDLGIAQGNNMMDAYYGTGDYVDNAYENINAMFGGLSKGFFQVVVLDNSPIQSMADLKGKKVCMGPAGNAAIILADLVWGKYGFSTADIKTTYVAYDDGISQLEDGNVDAVYIQAAIPASAIQQLAAGGKAYRLLSVDEDIANELCEEYGYFGYGTISTSVYDNMKEDVNTMFVSNMVAVRADLDEDLVYEMTKAIFENLDIIKSSHKAASGLSLETATRVSIPMHPGAERYFKEVGAM